MFSSKILYFIPIPLAALAFIFDVTITEWVATQQTDLWIKTFKRITDLGDGTEYFCTAAFILFLGYVNRGNDKSAFPLNSDLLVGYGWICVKVLFFTGITIVILKFGFGRSRPDLWIEQGIQEYVPFDFHNDRDFKSFPSGHTQTAFTAAVLLSLLLPKKLHLVLYGLAAAVGLSRVALLEHWLSDIIVGASIGFLLPMLIIRKSVFPKPELPVHAINETEQKSKALP